MKKNCLNHSRYVIAWAALALAVASSGGCGDAETSAISACESICARGDTCPNLYSEPDCATVCQQALADAKAEGGTCDAAMQDVVECHAGLSCDELAGRMLDPFHVDDCMALEERLDQCEPASTTAATTTDRGLSEDMDHG